MKEIQIKKKHHYVWSYYLKGWATDGVNVWYISKKGKPSFDSVKGIGCENFFYKVGHLNANDIKLINLWINDCSPELKSLHLEFVNFVMYAQDVAHTVENISQGKLDFNLKEVLSSNLFENYMSMQEGGAVEIIKKLRSGDLSWLDDLEQYRSFSYFLGHQFSRTKRMRDSILFSVENLSAEQGVKDMWREFYERHWWFMCSYLGTNISKDIATNSKRKVQVIENLTDKPLITSDQPVININPDGKSGTEIDYYYPLSDRRALLIINSGNNSFSDSITDPSVIEFFNMKIASFAGDTIYSSQKDAILEYKKAFDEREYNFSK